MPAVCHNAIKNGIKTNPECAIAENKYILDLRDFPGDPYESKVVHDVNVMHKKEF